jgi:hypothetical protein
MKRSVYSWSAASASITWLARMSAFQDDASGWAPSSAHGSDAPIMARIGASGAIA